MVLFFRLYDEPTCDLDTGLFSPGDSISFLATSDPRKSQPHSGDLSKPGEMRDERVSSKSQSSNRLSEESHI